MSARAMDYYRALYEETGECTVWEGTQSNGYGITMEKFPDTWFSGTRKRWGVHRLSWSLHNEAEIPDGHLIRHRCDNKLCHRADHLEIGVQRENVDDYTERFRS